MRATRMVHVRFEEKIRVEGKCWLWTAAHNSDDQPVMTSGSRRDGSRKKINVRRWSYQFYVAPIPAGLCAWTKCLAKLCVNPDHIVIGTRREFMFFRMKRAGFVPGNFQHFPIRILGELNPAAKISDAAVDLILAEKGRTKALVLARLHKVSEPTIYGIWNGTSRTKKAPHPSARFVSSKGLTTEGTIRPVGRIEGAAKPHQGETKCSTPS